MGDVAHSGCGTCHGGCWRADGCGDDGRGSGTVRAGASTAKCKPLDGLNVWATIAEGKPSPRTEVIYNVEPFRGAVRQGDWKLIWRTLLPTSVDLFNLAEDPYEKNNLAAAQPQKLADMKAKLNAHHAGLPQPLWESFIAMPVAIDKTLEQQQSPQDEYAYWYN